MSIKIMSTIWERGPDAQSERFVLLALADYANDEGECWPSVPGIAAKTCLSRRGVQKVIRRLQDAGWLEIVDGGGRKNCHLFRIKTANVVRPERGSPANVVPEKGERGSIKGEPGSPEPSRTIIEPSIEEADASLSDRPGSEIQQAVDIYNAAAKLSGWPSVQKLTAARSRSLKARMAEVGGIDGWEAAIEKASRSDFLCGRTSKPWTGLGFDWLVKEANFTKLAEGNYDNRTDNSRTNSKRGAGSYHGAFGYIPERG